MGLLVVILTLVVFVLCLMRHGDRTEVAQLTQRVVQLERRVLAQEPVAANPGTPAEVPAPTRYAPAASPDLLMPAQPVAPGPPRGPQKSLATDDEPRVHRTPPPELKPRTRSTIERVIAEHALALVGGVFVLVAVIFFVTYAVDQGWIGPRLRIMLAVVFGAALAIVGLRMGERLSTTERVGRAVGSLHGVLAGTGAAVMFLAIIAAVRVEQVLDPAIGVLAQLVVATGTVQVARRWRSQDLAAFGIGVALAAPMLVGAEPTGATVALVTVALLGAVVLAVLERWPRLLLLAGLLTSPQLAALADAQTTAVGVLGATLLGWWLVLVIGCIGCALRATDGVAPRSAVAVVLLAPPAVAGVFDASLLDTPTDRTTFLWSFAVVQLIAALAGWRRWGSRIEVLTIAFAGAAAATVAVAVATVSDGAPTVAAWSAEAVALAAIWWRTHTRLAAVFAGVATAAALGLAAFRAPLNAALEAPLDALDAVLAAGAITLAAVAARVVHARLDESAGRARAITRRTLDVLGGGALWHAVAIGISAQVELDPVRWFAISLWAAVGMLLAIMFHARTARVELAWLAGAAFTLHASLLLAAERDAHVTIGVALAVTLALGALMARWGTGPRAGGLAAALAAQASLVTVVLLLQVPPSNLRATSVSGFTDLVVPLLAQLGAATLAVVVATRWPHTPRELRGAAWIVAAVSGVYALSTLVVAAFTSELGRVEQDAQVALTLTWAVLGAAALVAGTSRRLRQHAELRMGAYALLGLGAVKLVLVDTGNLGTPMRMLAFLLTGLVLLGSAGLEQRMRATDDAGAPPPD